MNENEPYRMEYTKYFTYAGILTNRERYFVQTIEHILFENYKFRTKIQRCIFCKLAVFPVQREHITQNLILLLIILN